MFSFHVEAENPDALRVKVMAAVHAAGYIVLRDDAPQPEPDKAARKPRASKPKEEAAAPADPPTPPAASATETAGGTPTPSSAPASATPAAATDPDELRTKIRAVLTPLMNPESGKADQARALIKKFGANITTAAVDSLPVFLAEAEELAK